MDLTFLRRWGSGRNQQRWAATNLVSHEDYVAACSMHNNLVSTCRPTTKGLTKRAREKLVPAV